MALNNSTDIKELRKFDIDLEFGKEFELINDDILSGKRTAEIKTERDLWCNTGNICIELESRGKSSGLVTTQAEWWIHNLVKDDKIVCSLMFPTSVLKYLVRNYSCGKVNGGDDGTSVISLLSLNTIANVLADVDFDRIKK